MRFTSTYAILNGTASLAIIGLCISLYIQLLMDSRRFRNIGMNPYFALLGTVLKLWAFIMILSPISTIYLDNRELLMVQDAHVTVVLRALFTHLDELKPSEKISEMIPFLALYIIALGYVVFLIIVKNVRSHGGQYTATIDNNIDLHDFKGRE